jgi:hypothetical protein
VWVDWDEVQKMVGGLGSVYWEDSNINESIEMVRMGRGGRKRNYYFKKINIKIKIVMK